MSERDVVSELARARELIKEQQVVIEATLQTKDALWRSVATANEAFRSLNRALDAVLQLLDRGQIAQARDILAALVAVAPPAAYSAPAGEAGTQ